ncbi:enoyl-CoA hydratase-related protein [Pacificoceanicola onchidii]|uniref:enoyl-CoA hydratase-related protein n=1 Tax=Pacificoceanicola onchidii TaxID=2562685 RepID=UPI0010A528A7|nr:enoyl-CoA hydratase-related protein [Pacificoceanicola onchidii]
MVGYKIEERCAVLEVAKPPLNGLTRAVRAALMEAIDRAEEDDAAEAIVLIGGGATFPAGADLSEYDKGLQEPYLRDLCDRVEYSEKPVVAALCGTVLGGGLELALAAHYRVAQGETRLGFPEVQLGLPPGGGGTQRLPRLVGAGLALELLQTGRPVRARSARGGRLIDLRSDGDLRQTALAFCQRLLAEGKGARRLSDQIAGVANPMQYQKDIAAARAALKDEDSLAAQLVTLVEAAALLPFEAGRDLEHEIFDDCLASDVARGLRHAHRAEEAVLQGVRGDETALSILGSGALAVQLVARALMQGLRLRWAAKDTAALDAAQARLQDIMARAPGKPEHIAARMQGLMLVPAEEAAAQDTPTLLCEPGFHDLPVSRAALRLEAYPGTGTNIGLRFSAPAHTGRLAEVLAAPEASPAQINRAAGLVQALGKLPVVVKSTRETLAGRLGLALHRAADALLDQGANPYVVDAALMDWGLGRGLFRARDRHDLRGLAKLRFDAGSNWSAVLSDAGRHGASDGGGFYDWQEGKPVPSDAVLSLLAAHHPATDFAPDTLRALLLGAVANEGLRCLSTGLVSRASDIDVVSLHALGLPRSSGGVMHAVDLMGLFRVMKQMERLGHADTAFWTPQPVWADLVKNGKGFSAL